MEKHNLFESVPLSASPLADRMRPQTLDEVIGQEHIVGKGRLLRRAIAADRLSSLIFYGPPGTGKTSLARVIANTTSAYFESLNAVLAGVKDIRQAIDSAHERVTHYGKRTILFVDEVHRWNKAQQDALLPWVENGTIVFIGATTENPFFEVNPALVSRSRIFQLLSLNKDDLNRAALNAVTNREKGYGKWRVIFEDGALEHLVEVASGDVRSLLNAIELAVETTPAVWPPAENDEIHITLKAAEESIQRRAILYDRDGDYHFDTISAFIKSLRGSDVDAALYWLARMIKAGEDPAFIFRRMIILASEDVGMADPAALNIVISCAEAFDRIGFPEGNFPLAHACIYLATAPKSNSALAFFDAIKEVEAEDSEIPNHLRDPSRDKEGFGHGEGYVYPHAYREHWIAQQYLPMSLQGKIFYTPSENGYEGKIRDSIIKKKEMQMSVLLSDNCIDMHTHNDFLSAVKSSDSGREAWFKRVESGRGDLLIKNRDAIFKMASPTRSERILVLDAAGGLLLWEAARHAREGIAAGCVVNTTERDEILGFASSVFLEQIERPVVGIFKNPIIPQQEDIEKAFDCLEFDTVLCYEPWRKYGFCCFDVARNLKKIISKKGVIVFLQTPTESGERISRILSVECGAKKEFVAKLQEAETDFLKNNDCLWNENMLIEAWKSEGFSSSIEYIQQNEERLISMRDINVWFDSDNSRWGKFILSNIGEDNFSKAKDMLSLRVKQGPLLWKWTSIISRHVL
jgi:putative ATPase